jgi:hypothetical protein
MKLRQTERIMDNETLGSTSDLLTFEYKINTLSRNFGKESPLYAELYPRTAHILSYAIVIRRRTFIRRPLMSRGFHLVICFLPQCLGTSVWNTLSTASCIFSGQRLFFPCR